MMSQWLLQLFLLGDVLHCFRHCQCCHCSCGRLIIADGSARRNLILLCWRIFEDGTHLKAAVSSVQLFEPVPLMAGKKIYIYTYTCVCVVTLNIHLPAYRVQWPAGKVPKSSSNSLLQPRDSTPGIGMHFSALYGHSEVGRASRSSCLSHVHNWNTTLRGAILSLETATQLSKIRNPLKFVNKTGV